MKKTLKNVFLSVIICLLLAMTIHVSVTYVSIANDPYTSAPADVAFLLIIPYGIALGLCCAAWAIANRIVTNKNKNITDRIDKCN